MSATPVSGTHPRVLGWPGATALAMGGSNQSLFLIGALVLAQGSAAVPLLIIGLVLSWAATPGWIELILMWPNRVGGIPPRARRPSGLTTRCWPTSPASPTGGAGCRPAA